MFTLNTRTNPIDDDGISPPSPDQCASATASACRQAERGVVVSGGGVGAGAGLLQDNVVWG